MRITGHETLNIVRHDHAVRENGQVAQGTSSEETASAELSSADRVELSSRARDIQRIQGVLRQTPEIREDRVAAAKAALQSGTLYLGGADLMPKFLATLRNTDLGA